MTLMQASREKMDSIVRSLIDSGFREVFKKHTHVLCVSGGADSMALLAIYKELYDRKELYAEPIVFHLDHKIRTESGSDAEFVTESVRRAGFSCYLEMRSVPDFARRISAGLEEAGRILRYRILSRLLAQFPGSIGVTAHHADDYLESLLIHLVRGGGTSSLSTLPLMTTIHGATLFRPMLMFRKSELAFLTDHIEDKSNQDPSFLRNRIRANITPLLIEEGLDPVRLWKNFHDEITGAPARGPLATHIVLPRVLFNGVSRTELKQIIDMTLSRMGLHPASSNAVDEIQKRCRSENFRIVFHTDEFQVWSDRRGPVHFFSATSNYLRPAIFEARNVPTEIRYADQKRIIHLKDGESLSHFQPGMIVKIKSPDGTITKKLKQVFQEKGVPAPIRQNIPLVLFQGRVIRVCLSFLQRDDLIFER